MAITNYAEKDAVVSADTSEEKMAHSEAVPEKDVAVNRDYAGAAPKTDPAEIRLVRKLDFRIMVRIFHLSLFYCRFMLLYGQPVDS